MRAVVQRVSRAYVTVDGRVVGRIEGGLLVYLGVGHGDGVGDAEALATKVRYLRVFPDEAGKMNLDVVQAEGAVLLVSNFTLFADTRQGRRPAFTDAAPPETARELYESVARHIRGLGVEVQTGEFGAMMTVSSDNAGPINLLLETRSA